MRTKVLTAPDLSLPPLFTLVTLREIGDAFGHACERAHELGAGALVYVGRFDLAEFAVVLEPEEPLREARRAFYAGMAAMADALIAHAEPETEISITWPDALSVNLGLVGGGRLGWPKNAKEDEPPEWLVFGGVIRTVSMTGTEPGLNPLVTALEEEGFTEALSGQVVESFARNFLVALDLWKESSFAAVAKSYLERLAPEKSVRRNIDQNGDLLIRCMGKVDVERRRLIPALENPSWLDPKTKGPRA
jgi:biotin-(acetyl-CoA carboxylase) ligase